MRLKKLEEEAAREKDPEVRARLLALVAERKRKRAELFSIRPSAPPTEAELRATARQKLKYAIFTFIACLVGTAVIVVGAFYARAVGSDIPLATDPWTVGFGVTLLWWLLCWCLYSLM